MLQMKKLDIEMTGLSQVELASLREVLAPSYLVRWKAPKVCPACLREEIGSSHR